MNSNEKKVFTQYLQNREAFKNEIETIILKLTSENHQEEKDDFIQFFKENQHKNDLLESVATKLTMSILSELEYPYYMKKFDDLLIRILEEEYYDVYDCYFDEYHALFENNRFLDIRAYSGDVYAINLNKENPEIVFIDHASQYCSLDHIEELYSEEYGFYFDSTSNTYVNEKNLLIEEVFDEEGEYKVDSKYVVDYLNTVPSVGYSYHTFANYIISKANSKYLELFK